MQQVLVNILIHLLYFIGAVFLIGFAIHGLNKLFYRISGARMWFQYATGIIGTPIHELSHALACVVFGHKIKEMKLFQIDRKSRTLGYVSHTYNRKNLYHVIGNYFIGVAPILVGTFFLCLMMKILLPSAFAGFAVHLREFSALQTEGFSFAWILEALDVFLGAVKSLFSSVSVGWQFWVFLVLALCISFHMSLSGPDIKSALSALPLLLLLLAAVHAILFWIPGGIYGAFVYGLNTAGGYLIGMLLLSLMLAVFAVVLAFVFDILLRLFRIRR